MCELLNYALKIGEDLFLWLPERKGEILGWGDPGGHTQRFASGK